MNIFCRVPLWIVAACAVATAGWAADSNPRLVWLDSYEAAKREALVTGKPIFLEFRCAP